SGILRYVRIEYPGVAFAKDNEINGLTFGAVGRGTVVDYVQVAYSGDDSFEWFGGTVNCKHLIAFAGVDDDFDTDYGYSGKLQFLLGIRDPKVADQAGASNGFESDNDGSGSTNGPRTSPNWWNVTLIGPKATDATAIDAKYGHGLHLRRSSQNKIQNMLIVGWAKDGVYIDGTQTNTDAKNGLWWVKNSIVAGAAKAVDTTKAAGFDITKWFNDNSNRFYASNNDVKLNYAFGLSNTNALPVAGSPALTGGATPPSDGFFDVAANYVGAFGTKDWTSGWSTIQANPVDVEEEINNNVTPARFAVSQNFPNPFNPSTTIEFEITKDSRVIIVVYNILGQKVADLTDGTFAAGKHQVIFNANDQASGIYFAKVVSEGQSKIVKMLLVK
ncbi:MAG: T9SS type A sorting domain-containing protein, partial [Bacteroidia bacterium]|nr:T9SS type A sorting domain-containing protein [Bacteroidia bacterium]